MPIQLASEDPSVRGQAPLGQSPYVAARYAAAIGLVANLTLGIAKLAAGLMTGMIALLSDAVNSLGDSLASITVLYALYVAEQPADAEHPYGHTRAEAIAGSNIAVVLILSAVFVLWESVESLWTYDPTAMLRRPPVCTLWLAGTNVVIKELLYQYKNRVGRQTRSSAVTATAWDHRADALCAFAVLIGLTVVRYGGDGFYWADEGAAIFVVVMIVWSGIVLFRSTASELMDLQADPKIVQAIRDAAGSVEGVAAVEKLWVRKTGLQYLADIHLEVDAHLTVADGHQIGHAVKDALQRQYPELLDVLVHLEPHPHLHVRGKTDR